MKIIVGLGNPGEKYKKTRHNVGFMAVDALAEQMGLTWQKNKKFNAQLAKGKNIILVKPLSYMNNSGQVAQVVLSYYKLLPKKLGLIKQKNSDLSKILTIIHDDIDIPLGKYKISIDSRSAGHNGVQSIIDRLKTKNFKRIRIGIRTDLINKILADPSRRKQVEASKFVLQKFSKEELEIINNLIPEIIEELK
jgi:PTH1 family peptidyl-tRNA hydrolase